MERDRHVWYPLKFREILRPYGFGDRWIPRHFPQKDLPAAGVIAETWEVCDHGADSSVVRNGPRAGQTLNDLIKRHGPALLGARVWRDFGGRYPILSKFLDATHELWLQVHPDDDHVPPGRDEVTGKTEAWYLIDCVPGAVVHCGLKRGATVRDFYEAVRAGRGYECLNELPVAPGDMIHVPAGALHACRGGILIYELMQNCDITHGFSWALNGPAFDDLPPDRRAILDAIRPDLPADYRVQPRVTHEGPNRIASLLSCRYFRLDRLDLGGPYESEMAGDGFACFSCLTGIGRIAFPGGEEAFRPGESFLLPASLGRFTLLPDGAVSILRADVPGVWPKA